jgi:hypothetical protein
MLCRKMETGAFKLDCQRNVSYVHVESFGGGEHIFAYADLSKIFSIVKMM